MSELSVSSPAVARLFEEVDLASIPQSIIGRDACMFWQSERDGKLMPSSSRLIQHLPAKLFPFAFLFSAEVVTRDYVLSWAGHKSFAGLAQEPIGTPLKRFDNRRLAVRLRLALNLVRTRGEPVTVRFVQSLRNAKGDAEVFIAPVAAEEEGKLEFFGILAFRYEGKAW